MFGIDSGGFGGVWAGVQSLLQVLRHISRGKDALDGGQVVRQAATMPNWWHFLSEQARVVAGQLLRWKGDVDQDGYLLLKSVYVLTGTDSVSSRLLGPSSVGRGKSGTGCWHIPGVSSFFCKTDLFLLSSLLLSNMDFGV